MRKKQLQYIFEKRIPSYLFLQKKTIIFFLFIIFALFFFLQIKYVNVVFTQFISYIVVLLSFVVLFKTKGKTILILLLCFYALLLYFTLINNQPIVEQLSQDAFATFIVAILLLIKEFRKENLH